MKNSVFVVSRNVANLYANPDTSAEVVSQVVLGEFLVAQRKDGEFWFVTGPDGYQGWVRERAIVESIGDITGFAYKQVSVLFAEVYSEPNAAEEIITRLPLGARVAVMPERVEAYQRIMLPDLSEGWLLVWQLRPSQEALRSRQTAWKSVASRKQTAAEIGAAATTMGRRFIGTPYLWGGRSSFGIDCSAFTQTCYRLGGGVELLRDASMQINDERFEAVAADVKSLAAALKQMQEGDLVFFGTAGKVTHVGMFHDGRILHAGGGIGVVCQTVGELTYADQYIGARRLSAKAAELVLPKAS